jgi:hypothetical protein
VAVWECRSAWLPRLLRHRHSCGELPCSARAWVIGNREQQGEPVRASVASDAGRIRPPRCDRRTDEEREGDSGVVVQGSDSDLMNEKVQRDHGRASAIVWGAAVVALGLVFAFEAYTFVVRGEGDSPLPPFFGNFPANRKILEDAPVKGEFAFAVAGDTKSVGTFERIAAELRKVPLDFAVLLGDCSYDGSEVHHRYLRSELPEEYALPCPVFYVVGNHDVSLDRFPVARFEEMYGPSIFSFEYQGCLFVVLRILDAPFTNEESLSFLRNLRNADLGRYAHRFVFMHIPPPVSPVFKARRFAEADALVALFEEIGIDYVFAGDFHGYAQAIRRHITYTVTGGGGARLARQPGNQSHHAVVVRVVPDSVEMRILQVPPRVDPEDRLERWAITAVWPQIQRHPAAAVVLNAAALAGMVFVARRAVGRRGRTGER